MSSFEWGLFSKKALDSIDYSTARLNIWEGAVRSGKTVSSIVRWLDYIYTGPPGDLLMAGKTERTLKRNILDPITDIVGSNNFHYNRGTGEAFSFGRRIYVVGASDERAEGKIRGITLAGAYGDEITLWPQSFFQMLLSRLSVKDAKFFGSTNPDSPYHWLKTDYLNRLDLDLKIFSFLLEDNLNLDPKYIEALKKEYVGFWFKRFISGLWVLAEGAIYDMWDEAKHVVPCRDRTFSNHIVAIDYGTTNPCTFGLYGYDKTLPVYLQKEYYYNSNKTGRQKTDGEYADDFAEFLGNIKPKAIIIDPSAASFKTELKKRGFANVKAANNDVLDGIRFFAKLLANGSFFVDPSCISTITEFAGYVWDPTAAARGEEKPVKIADHAMDRNRYMAYTWFGKANSVQVMKKPL